MENLDAYDAGLLGDGGGGNVEWWQDYIRDELARAHEHYERQFAFALAAAQPTVKESLPVAPAAIAAHEAKKQQGVERKPVAWLYPARYGSKVSLSKPDPMIEALDELGLDWYCIPLYAERAPEPTVREFLTAELAALDIWLSKDEAQFALWDAITNRQYGNPTDDKLILQHLREKGFWIGRLPKEIQEQTAPADPLAELTAMSQALGVGYGQDEASTPVAAPEHPKLAVWFGPMPESNGKANWTALLHRADQHWMEGITIARSEYKDRVRYEADRMRHLIGELAEAPFILDYDADLQEPVPSRAQQAFDTMMDVQLPTIMRKEQP